MLEKLCVRIIVFYQQYARPLAPSFCRFQPTCSEYARQAIIKHGFARGGLKAIQRLLRCHPFSGKSGCDPLV